MATREESIRVTGDASSATSAIDATTQSVETLDKKTKSASKSAADAAKKQQGFTASLKASAASAAGLVAVLGLATQRYLETDAALGRLSNSQQNAGATAAEIAEQTRVAAEALDAYGITTQQSANALQKLNDASGSATSAARDYTLALDIAAQANIRFEDAVNLIAKARKGEVEELKNLRGLNKDQAQDLGKITDQATRSDLAIRALTAAYEGSAEANASAIDKQAAFKAQADELLVSIGDVTTAVGSGAAGLVGALSEMVGLTESGDDFFGMFVGGMGRFADAIREVQGPLFDIITGIAGLADGKSIADIISEADTRRALAEKKRRDDAKETSKEVKKETVEEVNAVIKGEVIKQEQVKKTAAARKKYAEQSKKDAEAEQKANYDDWKRWRDLRDQQEKERDELAFRERVARMKLEGDLRGALEAELNKSGATAGEKELALTSFDAGVEQQKQELELRERIAQLQIEGNDYEAERLAIINSSMTATEKKLALQELDEKQTADMIAVTNAYVSAIGGVGKAVAGAFLGGDDAKRASAAIDGAIASYQAIMAFWTGNFPAAIGLTTAAASAFAVAGEGGSAAPKSGGGSASAAPTVGGFSMSETSRAQAKPEPQNTTVVLNLSTINTVTPESGRAIVEGTQRILQSTIGGKK